MTLPIMALNHIASLFEWGRKRVAMKTTVTRVRFTILPLFLFSLLIWLFAAFLASSCSKLSFPWREMTHVSGFAGWSINKSQITSFLKVNLNLEGLLRPSKENVRNKIKETMFQYVLYTLKDQTLSCINTIVNCVNNFQHSYKSYCLLHFPKNKECENHFKCSTNTDVLLQYLCLFFHCKCLNDS